MWITPNPLISYHENYISILEKAQNILHKWKIRALTLIGKITVVNALVQSLFLHRMMSLPSPHQMFYKIYKNMILDFVWEGKSHKIAYNKLVQDNSRLGLKLVDLQTKELALKATWPVRWMKKAQLFPEQYNWIFEHLLIKDRRVWECNLSKVDRQGWAGENCISSVLHIWRAWCTYNYNPEEGTNLEGILNANIWANSNIRKANKPIFQKEVINSNVDKIIDIFDVCNCKFLSAEQVKERFGPSISSLTYFSIVAAIPRFWKTVLRSERLINDIDIVSKIDNLLESKQVSMKVIGNY